MKVCLVTPEYHGVSGYVGGLGVRYATLAPALVRAGIDLRVLTYGDGPNRTLEREGVRIVAVGRPPNDQQRFWEEVTWSIAADRALRRMDGIDLVYAPEWRGSLARYALRRRRAAVVTNLTISLAQVLAVTPDPPRPALRPAVRWPVQQRLERAQAERSDGFIATGPAALAVSRSLWTLERLPTAMSYGQIDVDRIRELVGGPLPDGFPAKGPVVAFSGRLQILKGVFVLVDAMRRVWDRRPDVQLVMLGGDAPLDGVPMSQHLRMRAGTHADRLHILGHQPRERLVPALHRADVVALPSFWESFSNAALEAMTLSRPVVVTTGSGYSDFCRDEENALMVQPRDPAAVGAAILRLLEDDTLRQRLGQAAALEAERHAVDPAAERHRDFFETIVARR